jgi:SAM-dependent methyltransferase
MGSHTILEERYTETFKTWNAVANNYEDKFMEQKIYDDTLKLLCDNLNCSKISVLEIGCGPGNTTRRLLKFKPDLEIFAFDVSSSMIELAKKNNPNVRHKVMDCRHLDQLNDMYDAIVCSFVIPYLSSLDCLNLFLSIHGLLKDSGLVYLSFVAGDYTDSGPISDNLGNKMYFYYHEFSTICQDLAHSNLEIINKTEKYVYQKGRKELHIILLIKKGKIKS